MTAHIEKWVRYSVSVIPPLPTSSMSGSFQPPGPAYFASGKLCFMMLSIEAQLSLMSRVVRHICPISLPHLQGRYDPHSQRL
ncbi:hypothetical protein SSPIM334S_04364 [Streptomyces spiroverticillatus]